MKFFSIAEISKRTIAGIFILKVIVGFIGLSIYTYYYNKFDAIAFFRNSVIIYDTLLQHPSHFIKMFTGIDSNNPILQVYYSKMPLWDKTFEDVLFNDSRTLIRLNVLFRFFSFGSFYVHIIFMCFLSLLGLTALYKVAVKYVNENKKLLIIGIFLLPSILFWTSEVLKEGLVAFAVGMLVYASNFGLEKKYTLAKILLLVLSISILLFIKIYVLIALLPGLFLNVWISYSSPKWIFLKYGCIILLFFCSAFILYNINSDYNLLKIIVDKQAKTISEARGGLFLVSSNSFICLNYNEKDRALEPIPGKGYRIKNGSSYMQWELDNMKDTTFVVNSKDTAIYKMLYQVKPTNTLLKLNKLRPTITNVLSNVPQALLNTLINPAIWNSKNLLQTLSAVETTVLILLIICTIIFFNPLYEHSPIIFFCFSFVLILFIIVGLITPVVAAIVRYKVPALPFLCIGLLLLMDTKKITQLFSLKNRK
jgi:uncharacterized membrane protein